MVRNIGFLLGGLGVLVAIVGALALVTDPPSVPVDESPKKHESILESGIYFKAPSGGACRHSYGGEVLVVDESNNPVPTARVHLILSRQSTESEPRRLVLDRETSLIGHSYVRDCLWDEVNWDSAILHVTKDGYSSYTRKVNPTWQGEKKVQLERRAYNTSLNSGAGKAGAG